MAEENARRKEGVLEARQLIEAFLEATTNEGGEESNPTLEMPDSSLNTTDFSPSQDEEQIPGLNRGIKKQDIGEENDYIYEGRVFPRNDYYKRRLEMERADTTVASAFFSATEDVLSMQRCVDLRAKVPATLASVMETALARHGVSLMRDQSSVVVALMAWLLSGAPIPEGMQFDKKSLASYQTILTRWKRQEFVWQALVEEETLAKRALLDISEADLFKTVVSPEARRRAIRAASGKPQVKIPRHIREEATTGTHQDTVDADTEASVSGEEEE